jgi:hypothetical protein
MIRILTADGPASTTVTVDGRLAGDCIDPVETCCTQAISRGKPVQLFLRDVSTIDESGRALLCRLAARGVRLKAAGIYSSYIVGAIRPEGRKHPAG